MELLKGCKEVFKIMKETMKTTLVIMAAGLGFRFGGGIKQLEGMGPNGEIIMDYSIHDTIEAYGKNGMLNRFRYMI